MGYLSDEDKIISLQHVRDKEMSEDFRIEKNCSLWCILNDFARATPA